MPHYVCHQRAREMQAPFKEVVSLPEAARRLGVSYERASRMLFTGRIKGEMFAGRWAIDVASLSCGEMTDAEHLAERGAKTKNPE